MTQIVTKKLPKGIPETLKNFQDTPPIAKAKVKPSGVEAFATDLGHDHLVGHATTILMEA